MFKRIVLSAAILTAATTSIGTASAPADVAGGCPAGGGWQLVSASIGPVATKIDQRGNQDGFVCQTFTSGFGQVIDNRVQAT